MYSMPSGNQLAFANLLHAQSSYTPQAALSEYSKLGLLVTGTSTCFSAVMMEFAVSWYEPELPGDLHDSLAANTNLYFFRKPG